MRPISVMPSASGAFAFTGLPSGNHELCATVSSDPYTDPCVWTSSGLPVTLQAGQVVTGVNLTVKKASTLQIVTVHSLMIVGFGEGGGWAQAGVGGSSEPQSLGS